MLVAVVGGREVVLAQEVFTLTADERVQVQAVGTIKDAFVQYPGIGTLLPALGYGERQIADLQETIERVDCDLVLIGTPIDLRRLVRFNRPAQTVGYELEEIGGTSLSEVLARVA